MIATQEQAERTREWITRFEQSLANLEGEESGLHPRLRQAQREAIEGQLEDLRYELLAYESLR